jgi:hypothetical protein
MVYVSSAKKLFSDTQLEDLLVKSRQNNAAPRISGMPRRRGVK